MKKYTDIKIARSDLRKLTEIFQYCKAKKEKLNRNLGSDEPFGIRCEAYVYRLALNEMEKRIREIKKNIRELDKEATKRDIERQIRERKEFNKKFGSIQADNIDEKIRDEEIYDLLIELKSLSEAFNRMVGPLYSGICANEMNEILDRLNDKYGLKVNYWQYIPGRVDFSNLDKLIEKYRKSDK